MDLAWVNHIAIPLPIRPTLQYWSNITILDIRGRDNGIFYLFG